MNLYPRHEEFYNQPLRLNVVQQLQPQEIINAFFKDHSLYEIRNLLGNMLRAAIAGDDNSFANAADRRHLLYFQEELEELLEAAFIISRNYAVVKKKKSKTR